MAILATSDDLCVISREVDAAWELIVGPFYRPWDTAGLSRQCHQHDEKLQVEAG